jgi:Streptomycin adenylyltransferase
VSQTAPVFVPSPTVKIPIFLYSHPIMGSNTTQLPQSFQVVVDRFVNACQSDPRVVAAFLGGSYAKGSADAYSDLDLGLITTDGAYENLLADRQTFIRQLGDPIFLESFNLVNVIFFIFPDGTEGELSIGHESDYAHIHTGPYYVLLDKKGLLLNTEFPSHSVSTDEQIENLRKQIDWFWHDLSHFITAMGRGQLWWAHGQLEILRLMCVNLARLQHDFAADGGEAYDKLDKALPVENLAPLQNTFCPLDYEPMLEAGSTIVHFYRQLAPILAQQHGLSYPTQLEHVMLARLEKLRNCE